MINWREVPFVRLLIPVITGILSAIYFDYPIHFLNYLLPVTATVLLLLSFQKIDRQYRWFFGFLINVFFISLAYQFTYYHNDIHHSKFIGLYESNAPVFVVGTITNMPDKSREKWIKVELNSRQIGEQKDSLKNCRGTVLVYIENSAESQDLLYGDALILQTRLSAIAKPKNPKSFDYQSYLKFQNIHFQSFIKRSQWHRVAQQQANPIFETAFKWRLHFLKTLKKHLIYPNEFAVGSALILGYKDELPEELREAYAGTGAMHVLAVSGLHVGLVYGILMMLLNLMRINHRMWRYLKIILLICGIWAFALLTGASASVLRASTMFTFIAFGKHLDRPLNTYNTLLASAFCLLLYDPFLIKNVGFQLSYLAVFGIIYFQPKIARLWIIENKVGDFFWTLASVSVAATISTLPISLFYFHQFPVYFWLSGLVVVPAATVILWLGIALFLLDGLIPLLGSGIGLLLYGVIWGVNSLIFLIKQMPLGLITGLWISSTATVLLYIMLGGVVTAINTKKMKWLLGATTIMALLSISFAYSRGQQFYKKEIVIYHIYKNTLIDCIDGTKVFSIKSDSIDTKAETFAAQNYRWSQGIQSIQHFNLSDTNQVQNTWMYQKHILGFYDKKMAILNKNIKTNSPHKIKVNYLLLQGNANIYIEKLRDNYEFELLLFDASTSTWKIKKWKEKCLELGIDYYDINERGAFITSFDLD